MCVPAWAYGCMVLLHYFRLGFCAVSPEWQRLHFVKRSQRPAMRESDCLQISDILRISIYATHHTTEAWQHGSVARRYKRVPPNRRNKLLGSLQMIVALNLRLLLWQQHRSNDGTRPALAHT